MVLPDVPATIFEGEAELAVVIGKRASNVKAADAMDYVFGYTNFIDGSARGLPPAGNVFFQMKSRDTFAPIGPYLVTKDEIPDPQQVADPAVEQRHLDAELQHQRHGAQDPALHRVAHLDPHLGAGRHHRHRHQPSRPQLRSRTATRSSSRSTDSAGSPSNVKDELKRSWGRETRLQMHEKAAQKTPGNYPDITPQLTGKHAAR